MLGSVTGLPIHELLHDRLLGPLGMTASVAAITDDIWTDHAIGYEPMLTDRPAQLRHPLVPAPRIVSNTADGSIVSNVVDMCAYARLLLARGDRPDGRGGRILSEEGFARLMAGAVEDGEHGLYGYGLWYEDVDGRRWHGHSGGMVGYTALLITVPEEGLACMMLQNGGGDRRPVVGAALAAVRAGLAGDPLPEPWAPPAPTEIPGANRFTGTYVGDDGRTLVVEAEDDGLSMSVGPVSARLERDPLEQPHDTFLVAHPAFERFPIEFRGDDSGHVVEAFHGNTWFRGERYEGPEPGEPPESWPRHRWAVPQRRPLEPGAPDRAAQGPTGDRVADGYRQRGERRAGGSRRRLVRGGGPCVAATGPLRGRCERRDGRDGIQRRTVVPLLRAVSGSGAQATLRNATQAFCPPNPKEFDRASVTSSSRASFGT